MKILALALCAFFVAEAAHAGKIKVVKAPKQAEVLGRHIVTCYQNFLEEDKGARRDFANHAIWGKSTWQDLRRVPDCEGLGNQASGDAEAKCEAYSVCERNMRHTIYAIFVNYPNSPACKRAAKALEFREDSSKTIDCGLQDGRLHFGG